MSDNTLYDNTLPDNKLSDIDLEYLINKELYGKSIDSKMQPHNKSNNKKDKKFYKRRIYDLTKQLLSNEQPPTLFPDVQNTFDNYIKTCISYFKVIDTSDIIQEDYDNLLGPINNATSLDNVAGVDNIDNIDEINKLMMRSIKIMEPKILLIVKGLINFSLFPARISEVFNSGRFITCGTISETG